MPNSLSGQLEMMVYVTTSLFFRQGKFILLPESQDVHGDCVFLLSNKPIFVIDFWMQGRINW